MVGPMTEEQVQTETLSLLQDLGLKEYEARCFLALTKTSPGTAKEISDLSEVPRTRVYDAIRVLEAQGLVEVKHSNPKEFRAVSVEEAASTLRQKYDDRIDTLQTHLESLDLEDEPDEDDRMQEVWSLTGHEAIQSRALELVEEADSEVVLIVVDESMLTESLFDCLEDAIDRGVSVLVGGKTQSIIDSVESELPSIQVFETEFDWLVGPEEGSEVAVGRVLFVDRETLLVSSFYPDDGHGSTEQAIFAAGLGNGVVVLLRRIIGSGLMEQIQAQ